MKRGLAVVQVTLRQDADHVVGVQVNRVGIRRRTITAAPAHDVPGAGSEEVLPRHRGEGRLDLRISDAGGRRDLLRIDPPDDLQFALAIHLGRIWLVRRSGQDSTAFECRVLAANRNPVADPMPAETMFPLSRTRPHAAAVRHGPAHCRRKREGATQFPTIGLFERNANNFKGTRNTKAQKSWSSRAEPEVRVHLPPAASRMRT
jgi:hypothetical protein